MSKHYTNSNARALYRQYRKGAARRGHEFDVSPEWFIDITQQPCYLCGSPPSQSYVHHSKRVSYSNSPYIYNGVDRLDNTIGYVSGNMIACCGNCNLAKKQLSLEAFLSHIVRVYEYNFVNPETKEEDAL